MDNPKFVYVTYITTTPERLWAALTSSEFTTKYWFGLRWESDWRVGSRFASYHPDGRLGDSGEILASDPPRRLEFTFTPDHLGPLAEPPSRVTYELEPLGGQVKLTVTHTDFEPGSVVFEGIRGGWPKILSSLKSLLETGTALELTQAAFIRREIAERYGAANPA